MAGNLLSVGSHFAQLLPCHGGNLLPVAAHLGADDAERGLQSQLPQTGEHLGIMLLQAIVERERQRRLTVAIVFGDMHVGLGTNSHGPQAGYNQYYQLSHLISIL